jgi:hypothetical protein
LKIGTKIEGKEIRGCGSFYIIAPGIYKKIGVFTLSHREFIKK